MEKDSCMSIFIKICDNPNTPEEPDNNDTFDLEQYPYQYKFDRNLNEKFDSGHLY